MAPKMHPIMYSQNQSIYLDSIRSYQQQYPSSNLCQQFSFNCYQQPKNYQLIQQYSSLYNSIKTMKCQDITQLLIQKIDQYQQLKLQLASTKNKLFSQDSQLIKLKTSLAKKTDALNTLCQTTQKNLSLIQKLQNKLSKQTTSQHNRNFQQKYQQLRIYMNQYIININIAQQQYKKSFTHIKNQNQQLHKQLQNIHHQLQNKSKYIDILTNKLNQVEISYQSILSNFNIVNQCNHQCSKSVSSSKFHADNRDKSEFNLQSQRNLISSSLSFISNNNCQQQITTSNIIQKLQHSSLSSQAFNQISPHPLLHSHPNSQYPNNTLQHKLSILTTQNKHLKSQLQTTLQQLKFINQQKDSINDNLAQQKIQKQAIKKQLAKLHQQIKYMKYINYHKEQQHNIISKNKQNQKQRVVKNVSNKLLKQLRKSVCDYPLLPSTKPQNQQIPIIWQNKKHQQSISQLQQKSNLSKQCSSDHINC